MTPVVKYLREYESHSHPHITQLAYETFYESKKMEPELHFSHQLPYAKIILRGGCGIHQLVSASEVRLIDGDQVGI